MKEEGLFENDIADNEEQKNDTYSIKSTLLHKYPDTVGLAYSYNSNLTPGQLAFLSDINKVHNTDISKYLCDTTEIESNIYVDTY
jgi:hypothetical protein